MKLKKKERNSYTHVWHCCVLMLLTTVLIKLRWFTSSYGPFSSTITSTGLFYKIKILGLLMVCSGRAMIRTTAAEPVTSLCPCFASFQHQHDAVAVKQETFYIGLYFVCLLFSYNPSNLQKSFILLRLNFQFSLHGLSPLINLKWIFWQKPWNFNLTFH